MNLIDRVRMALANPRSTINPSVFEEFATTVLSELHPGLVPVRGGTDWGADADLADDAGDPVWMTITSSPSVDGARKNLVSSLDSLIAHGMDGKKVIAVSLASIDRRGRDRLKRAARARGFELVQTYDRDFFGDRLLRLGDWREKLLGLRSGPYALSPRSPRAASSARTELIGRDDLVLQIAESGRDVIVVGAPGIGKTALVEAVPGIRFIADEEATTTQLLGDIMDDGSTVIAVDDAARIPAMLVRLDTLRRTEKLQYRVVAICWPQQQAEIATRLPDSKTLVVDPLPRNVIGEICRNYGVRRHDLVGRVVAQAHGRPGWAVRLITTLLTDETRNDFFTGQAVNGWVRAYLLRAGLPGDSLALLSILGMIGHLDTDDVDHLADLLQMTRRDLAAAINALAAGGLLDVEGGRNDGLRYSVAPRQLHANLIADAYLRESIPAISARTLYDRWPDRRIAIATGIVHAARVSGVHQHRLVTEIALAGLADAALPGDSGRLIQQCLLLNATTAAAALDLVERTIAPTHIEHAADHYALAVIGGHDRTATTRFLDTALSQLPADPKGVARSVERFVREVRQFGPYPAPNVDALLRTGQEAQRWASAHPTEETGDLQTQLLADLLAPVFDATYQSPDDIMSINMIGGVHTVAAMDKLISDIWMPYQAAAQEALRPNAALSLIALVGAWARAGRGHGMAYNGTIPRAQQTRARVHGRTIGRWIRDHLPDNPFIRDKFRGSVSLLGLDLPDPDSLASRLLARRPRGEDWASAFQAQSSAIASAIAGMSMAELSDEVAAIKRYEAEADSVTASIWRVWRAVTDLNDDLCPWIAHMEDVGLLDDAAELVGAAAERHQLTSAQTAAYMNRPTLRNALVNAALAGEAEHSAIVLSDLRATDLLGLEYQMERVPGPVLQALLNHDSGGVAATTALLMADPERPERVMITPDLHELWRTAASKLRLPLPANTSDNTAHLRGLAAVAPDLYAAILLRADPTDVQLCSEIPWTEIEQSAPGLPDQLRTTIYMHWRESFASDDALRAVTGADIAWLRRNVEDGVVTPDAAVSVLDGDGPQPTLEEVAAIVIPRGMDPLHIARTVEFGVQWGEDHQRIEGYIKQFRGLAEHPDENIRTMSAIAVAHYSTELEAAKAEARRRAI
ncbi:hypothetical protein AAIB33_07355 [Microbacterium sp. AZCO]|uniref:hypothetical protein n=1 Tax=Microbacterium sp. AZCO TaxID=3142976 RepID=UPI0031F3E124